MSYLKDDINKRFIIRLVVLGAVALLVFVAAFVTLTSWTEDYWLRTFASFMFVFGAIVPIEECFERYECDHST